MASTADLGTKHECPNCEVKYYDLGKADPHCPKCGASLTGEIPEGETAEAKEAEASTKKKKTTKKKAKK